VSGKGQCFQDPEKLNFTVKSTVLWFILYLDTGIYFYATKNINYHKKVVLS